MVDEKVAKVDFNWLMLIILPLVVISCGILYVFTRQYPHESIILKTEESENSAEKYITNTKKLVAVPRPNCTNEEFLKTLISELPIKLPPPKFKKQEQAVLLNEQNEEDDEEQKQREAKGHFVIYIAVVLLLTSLVAALVDVYKVKGKPSKNKPQLTKRCSLADLTVLRHSRRESMRKDSMTEEQRGPIKLLGARPLPENRRCSFPISYPGDGIRRHGSPVPASRKTSLDYYDGMYSYDFQHNRVVRLIRRC